jgi:hypothetical protein
MPDINFLIIDQHVIQLFNDILCRLIIIQFKKPCILDWPFLSTTTLQEITVPKAEKAKYHVMPCYIWKHDVTWTHIKFQQAIIKSS